MTLRRILFVASTFPANDFDTAPAFVRDQVLALKKRYPHLEISVIAPHDSRVNTKPYQKHNEYDEYRFHYAWPRRWERLAGKGIMPALKSNPLLYGLVPFFFMAEFFFLLQKTIKLQPDLIYAHWFTPQAINAQLVGAVTKTKFAFTTHSSDVEILERIPIIGKKIVRRIARKAAAITAVSRRSMKKLSKVYDDDEWKYIERKFEIIPMGVSIPEYRRKESHAEDDKKIIAFIGRLVEKKGLEYLLDSFAQILLARKDVKLIVAGDGILRNRLENISKKLGLKDSVEFVGHIAGEKKAILLSSSSVYVVPSIIAEDGDAEGLPVSLLEGLSYGNICVATCESGADDIIRDGHSGFLVQHKNSVELKIAIEKALSLTAIERAVMQEKAIETAKSVDWNIVAARHYTLFERAIQEKPIS